MKKIGQILKNEGKYSWVKMERGTPCGEGECPLSSPLIDDSKSDFYVVQAYNDLGASPGDRVLVEINDHIALRVAFLIYIFPILLTLSVYFLLRHLTPITLYHYLGVAVSIVFSFFLLKKEDQRLQLHYRITDLTNSTCESCPLANNDSLISPKEREKRTTR
ncbi:MAG: sigma-E factor negative regulatory protein RseC [Candidatus Atribacteria bacterium]|nr:sigma-E factor negative regulatory protein RseC [Candidatus Atribacteria bacterium]